jgi:hypothetical protein
MIVRGARTVLVGADNRARQAEIAFEVAAGVALNRPMFDGPEPPLTGAVAWLVDREYQRENLWNKMVWWRKQKGLPIGTEFSLKPVLLAHDSDPVTAIESYLHRAPALIVRDYSTTASYDEGNSYALFDWLDVTAPALAKAFNAAVLTCISARLGSQDLANRCEVLVCAKRAHEMSIELHHLQPRGPVLKLQPRSDSQHTLLIADRVAVAA